MIYITLVIAAAILFAGCSKKPPVQQATMVTGPLDQNWAFSTTPAWLDEFEQNGPPDPFKWAYDIDGNGWGNHELQYCTSSTNNARGENGTLLTTARKERYEGNAYTPARLITKNKADFLYGRFEIKATLPSGKVTCHALGCCLPTGSMAHGQNRAG